MTSEQDTDDEKELGSNVLVEERAEGRASAKVLR